MRAGYGLIPLGGGEEGKSPLRKFADGNFQLRLVMGAMLGAGSHMFAVRLAGVVVVDLDTFSDENVRYIERRFGRSPMTVRTPRGMHFYYRHEGRSLPKTIVYDDLQIDFKRGVDPVSLALGRVCCRDVSTKTIPPN